MFASYKEYIGKDNMYLFLLTRKEAMDLLLRIVSRSESLIGELLSMHLEHRDSQSRCSKFNMLPNSILFIGNLRKWSQQDPLKENKYSLLRPYALYPWMHENHFWRFFIALCDPESWEYL